jgi:MoaA/NifB/PqqE/SkfB family radical SAM enzyme
MIKFDEIKEVHLEISTLCNSSCPLCPRTFWGYPYNAGYPEVNFTLEMATNIFDTKFLQQLTSIYINGNFGDIVMNPEGADIVEYFKKANPNLQCIISTNGGARNKEFWKKLARADVIVEFCIDGLEDTHHLYRQNTIWKTVVENAKTFIAAGGLAIWKIIKFDHNQHQIEKCRELSKELKFSDFIVIDNGRNTGPIFDQKGQLIHIMGNYSGEKNFKILFHKKKTDLVLLEDIIPDRLPKQHISCYSKTAKSIYIAANGDVSPCCWTGFYPKTFGHGEYHQAVNAQLIPLIKKNNAFEYSLEECISWFISVEKSWNALTYEQGRLVVCDDNCGLN